MTPLEIKIKNCFNRGEKNHPTPLEIRKKIVLKGVIRIMTISEMDKIIKLKRGQKILMAPSESI